MQVDFIIVGQGLAGINLAHHLWQKKYSYVAFSNPKQSATQVAAGIIHPITGRRLVKSWLFDEAYPYALDTYQSMATKMDVTLFKPLNIVEIFTSVKHRNDWYMRSNDADINYLLETEIYEPLPGVIMPLGGMKLKSTGCLQTSNLVKSAICSTSVRQQVFDYSQLQIKPDKVIYQDITARYIVFCEGCDATNNPVIEVVPFQLSKGEIIEVYCENLQSSHILNRNNFVLPMGDNLFKVGSTYQWQQVNNQPSKEARMHLAQMFKQITHLPFEITNHWAAIRPTIKDRRPVVKWQQKNVGIFNGLGTKGVLLAPLMAKQLIDNMPAY